MKKIISKLKENYLMLIIVLLLGLLMGYVFFGNNGKSDQAASEIAEHEGHDHGDQDPATWTCSMHPQIKQDKPGDCPICGMDLVPLSTLETGSSEKYAGEIMMTEEAASLADIQTSVAKRGRAVKTIFLQGEIEADERKMAEITARFGGRIERLHISFTGEQVDKGAKLATLYSPDLVNAQRELLEAYSVKENRPSIYKAARSKLKLWDLSDKQIDMIESRSEPQLYFDVLSPVTGTVMERHVSMGDYVDTGEPLFMVADLSSVWVVFDAYEDDLPWIREGDSIEFSVRSIPGKTFRSVIDFIDPFIDTRTRTAGLRVEINNGSGVFKPGMFTGGRLYSEIAKEGQELLIPRSAILWTGKRSVVYVKVPEREAPSFKYREIELGPVAGDYYIVASGLKEGEEIATNGVFKIDAAAQLEGKPSMMNPEGGMVSTGHDHGNMNMDPATGRQEVSSLFRDQLTDVYDAYIDMKNAFVETDAPGVRSKASAVSDALKNVDMSLLEGDAHMEWMDYLKVLENSLKEISESDDIQKQRNAFLELNNTIYPAVKTFGVNKNMIYYQYCPMADNDRGGYWLSNEKEIRNPYFGDMMLKCGEVRETIITAGGGK
ncbi:MAG: efflux RND transporter periplasmic adaptor subunit [Bacteroidales bacterium]|nr:efflux RND transporter periplasmic adaptor subunit [Bacteroidales bacterium]